MAHFLNAFQLFSPKILTLNFAYGNKMNFEHERSRNWSRINTEKTYLLRRWRKKASPTLLQIIAAQDLGKTQRLSRARKCKTLPTKHTGMHFFLHLLLSFLDWLMVSFPHGRPDGPRCAWAEDVSHVSIFWPIV